MSVVELVKDIKVNLSQRSASQKDEVRVMQAMLNDKTFKVGEYTKEGKVGEYCPREDAEKLVSTVLTSAAKLSAAEAKELADKYEYSKAEATGMVNISKEFVNTYVKTGRKLALGGREDMNVSLSLKEVEASTKQFPKNGVGSTERGSVEVPAHCTIKTSGPCPVWLKK